MILPKKHLSTDRCLLYVGAEVLGLLNRPRTVSNIWHDLKAHRSKRNELSVITYDWFILSLDFLHALGAIAMEEDGLLRRKSA
ncbi:MAG: ABC-three component system middle component 6 [Thermoanaerobaculia bacterium]